MMEKFLLAPSNAYSIYCFSVDCSVPQGSVFGPLGFASYTEDVADLMDRHNVQFHSYTEDTQFLDCCRSTDTASLRARLSSCASDIGTSCRLQLDASKTEAIWFSSKPNSAALIALSKSAPRRFSRQLSFATSGFTWTVNCA